MGTRRGQWQRHEADHMQVLEKGDLQTGEILRVCA